MTDDVDLRERLAQLGAAVPVDDRGSISQVRRAKVDLGGSSRQIAPTALLTVLAIAATGVLIAGVLRVGPFGPAASGSATPTFDSTAVAQPPNPSAADGPQVGRDSQGPFSVEIRTGRRVYRESEAIDVTGVFTYSGDHDISVAAPWFFPVSFGIREPVHGLVLSADTAVPLIAYLGCPPSLVVRPGEQRENKFAISGFSPSPPSTEEQLAFLTDPELRLPPGTWHLLVQSSLQSSPVGSCDGDFTRLAAEIEIEVVAAIPDQTGRPSEPTPSTQPTDAVIGRATDGPYELELRSAHGTYHESDPIDIVGAFTYSGTAAIDVSGFWPLNFSVDEPVYGFSLSWFRTLMCANGILAPGYRLEQPFAKGGGISASEPNADFHRAYLDDPVFRLPPGTWHIRVAASLTDGKCIAPATARHSLSAGVEIVVLPDP